VTPEVVLFYLFAAITVGGALGVVFIRRIVHSALALMVSLFGVAALFVLLEAPFLAAAQVLLYVGGIAILILFGVVVAQQRGDRPLTDRSPQAPLAALIIAVIVIWMSHTVLKVNWESAKDAAVRSAREAAALAQIVPHPETAAQLGEANQPVMLGHSLSRTYVLPFEIASLLLLVALLGAMMMLRRQEDEDEKAAQPSEVMGSAATSRGTPAETSPYASTAASTSVAPAPAAEPISAEEAPS
jgi:NADH-quinone oxidoreductase subunit J